MERVTDLADPERCKGAAPDGQCLNRIEGESDYCRVHGGRDNTKDQLKRQYLLTEANYRTRLAQLAEHDEIKSLREEVALARMLIETRVNACRTDAELLASTGPINTQLLTLERLVRSCNQIEQNLGSLLSKTTVLKLGQLLCRIVVEELEDIDGYEAIVDRITHRLIATISNAQNVESNPVQSHVALLPAPTY